MNNNHLIYRLVSIIGENPARDLEAEDALTRALARNGGDGLTTCHEDAGVCPKPCLRHRRVNVGIWPNWRMRESFLFRKADRKWKIGQGCCNDALPGTTTGQHLDSKNCGTYQDHLDLEDLRQRTANYIQKVRDQARSGPVQYLAQTESAYLVDSTPNGASGAFGALLDSMVRQARNISDNMGISPLWDREPNIINPPDTTWYAQYPEQVWNERSEPQWTVTSTAPRPFEGKTYRFDPISITVPLPAESPQPFASPQPLLDASIHQPAPDSEA